MDTHPRCPTATTDAKTPTDGDGGWTQTREYYSIKSAWKTTYSGKQ